MRASDSFADEIIVRGRTLAWLFIGVEPPEVPGVTAGAVPLTPPLPAGSPFPGVQLVVQPKAARESVSDTARAKRDPFRACKPFDLFVLRIMTSLGSVASFTRLLRAIAVPSEGGNSHCSARLAKEITQMKRYAALVVILALFSVACGSMNRATPASVDKTVMEADVRGKIATAVPEKTFAVEVSVGDGGVVTLSGHAANASDRDKIADAARSVNGVTRVINNIHVE
jgi:hypothetical protein